MLPACQAAPRPARERERLAPIVRSSVTGGRAATPGRCASTDPTSGRDRLAAAPVDKRVRARHSPTAMDTGGGAHPRRPDRIRPARQAPRRRRRPGVWDRPTARERAITARVTPRGRHPDSPGPGRPPRTDQTRLPGPAPRHRCERPGYGERERHGRQRDHGGGGYDDRGRHRDEHRGRHRDEHAGGSAPRQTPDQVSP